MEKSFLAWSFIPDKQRLRRESFSGILEAEAGRQSEAKNTSTYGNSEREAIDLQDFLV